MARSVEENLAGVVEAPRNECTFRRERCIEAKREGPIVSIKEVSAERAEPLTRTQVLHTRFLKVGAFNHFISHLSHSDRLSTNNLIR